jgi:hypothetical protein
MRLYIPEVTELYRGLYRGLMRYRVCSFPPSLGRFERFQVYSPVRSRHGYLTKARPFEPRNSSEVRLIEYVRM